MRLMRALFALLVMVVFGCMPALVIASPATASPPTAELICVMPEAAHVVQLEANVRSDRYLDTDSRHAAMTGGDASMAGYNSTHEPNGYPLRE